MALPSVYALMIVMVAYYFVIIVYCLIALVRLRSADTNEESDANSDHLIEMQQLRHEQNGALG